MQVKDLMLDRFSRLAVSLSPSEALQKIVADALGVVVDAAGNPVSLVSIADLIHANRAGANDLNDPKAELPPTIVVGSAIQMKKLAQSNLVTLSSLGANGAIVLGGPNIVIGVLSFDSITLRLFDAKRATLAKAASTLPGDPTTPQAMLRCKQCNFINKINFIDHNNLPDCQNPVPPQHTLKL